MSEATLVIKDDVRHTLTGSHTRCGYCPSELGTPHEWKCVCNVRPIRFRLVAEWDDTMPASWDDEMILFSRNEGTWCVDNAFDKINPNGHPCLCTTGVRIEIVE